MNVRRIVAASAAALVVGGSLGVATAVSASAACTVTSWSTYTQKSLSVYWTYAGSTARVVGRNEYQSRSYCGYPQYRSKLALTAYQGAYTKAINADIRWSNGTHSTTYTFPATRYSPTNTQTTTVAIGFKHTKSGAQSYRTMTFDY